MMLHDCSSYPFGVKRVVNFLHFTQNLWSPLPTPEPYFFAISRLIPTAGFSLYTSLFGEPSLKGKYHPNIDDDSKVMLLQIQYVVYSFVQL